MTQAKKPYVGMGMEGMIARWYARNTGKRLGEFRKLAVAIAAQVAAGASILEVAPGPGYLAIELAKLGVGRVVGLDVSKTFVSMAAENASKAGVTVSFLHGNASAMPLESAAFDFIVCRAAFKNFSEPVEGAERDVPRAAHRRQGADLSLARHAAPEAVRSACRA